MRLTLAILSLLLSSAVFAGVTCIQLDNNTWQCSGVGTETPGGGYPTIVTNMLGVCTNCVAMTPDFCTQTRSQILTKAESCASALDSSMSLVRHSLQSVNSLIEEGDKFAINTYSTANTPAEYPNLTEWIKDQPQSPYLTSSHGVVGSNSPAIALGAANNSIATYYQQSVGPALHEMSGWLSMSLWDLEYTDGEVRALHNIAGQIDCTQCLTEGDLPGLGGGSGGDSGGGSGSGSPGSGGDSSCCVPCVEQLEALNLTASSISQKVNNIDTNVKSIVTKLDAFKQEVRQCFDKLNAYASSISNSTYRIDSYLRTDLDAMARDISTNVVLIAQNVDGIQREYFEMFKWSNYYLDNNGNPFDNDLEEVQTNFLSAAEYSSLPWPLRVEMLLLSLAKPFQGSDSIDQPSESVQNQVTSAVEKLESLDPAERVQSFSGSAQNAMNSIVKPISQLASVFNSSHLPQSIQLLDSHHWFGDTALVVNLDPDICDPCRVVFGLIWAVIALVMTVRLWLLAVRCVLPVFEWVRKLVRVLVKA